MYAIPFELWAFRKSDSLTIQVTVSVSTFCCTSELVAMESECWVSVSTFRASSLAEYYWYAIESNATAISAHNVAFSLPVRVPTSNYALSQIKSKLAIESARYTSPSAPPRSQFTYQQIDERSIQLCFPQRNLSFVHKHVGSEVTRFYSNTWSERQPMIFAVTLYRLRPSLKK